jgi:hypothetical protein
VTPYRAAVIQLTAPETAARLLGNLLWDGGGHGTGMLASAADGASLSRVTGTRNWLAPAFAALQGTGLDPASNHVAPRGVAPGFSDPAAADYRLRPPAPGIRDGGPLRAALGVACDPGGPADAPLLSWQYRHPRGLEPRRDADPLDCGAYGE